MMSRSKLPLYARLMRLGGRQFARLARRRSAWAIVGLIALIFNAIVTLVSGIPSPDSHDERSYLLAADTFAHGRLTNPTHPMWQHMEAFHVLQTPTYMSKYPPGQGLLLALGKVLTGEAIVGAWLASAAACAGICWAIRMWLPPRMALAAGLFATTHVLLIYWAQNYWGGALAACGGALVFGAIGRLRRRISSSSSAILAAGLAILMMTRPFEGLVLMVLFLPLLPIKNCWRQGRTLLMGFAAVMVPAMGWLGYYNFRVTGNALMLPYVLYERQYSETPLFVWGSPKPPKIYRSEFMKRVYHDSELVQIYLPQTTLAGFAKFAVVKLRLVGETYFFPSAPALGLLGLPWALKRRSRKTGLRRATTAIVLFIAVLMLANWYFSHYAAPMFAALLFVEMAAMRVIGGRLRPVHRVVMPLLLLTSAVLAGIWVNRRIPTVEKSWGRSHDALVSQLLQQPGKQLVLVRYRSINNLNHDWVANKADIDGSKIVWARDMGPEKNKEIIKYFTDRNVWLMTVDGDDAAVIPLKTDPS